MRLEPKLPSNWHRIDGDLLPPFGLVSVAVKLAMMPTAERHGELIADFATKRAGLRKAQVMGVARLTTADQTGLLRYMAHVVTVTDAARLGERQKTLVDRLRGT